MEIELPSGCNIINSASSFLNYTNNNRTRALYYIVDGQVFKSSETYSNVGFDYSGTCLSTGDLIYKPEYSDFWLPFTSIVAFVFILGLIYHIIIRRLLP